MRERRGWVERAVLGALLCGCFVWATQAAAVRANDFEEFESARTAYETQDYARAAKLFDALGGGDTPALTNRSLLLESKKYLGASYLFLGQLRGAEQEFERLLRMDPQYMLDPLGFPEEVQRLFAQVKTRLDTERKVAEDERRREENRLRTLETQREQHDSSRWVRMREMAETEHVSEVRSRWVAMVPFGVGQFQNGHVSLGAILAVSEGSLLAIGVVSWAVHENLRGLQPTASERDEYSLTERATRYTNQISTALLAVLAITGVVDAQLRFQGTREYERKRPLPADLSMKTDFSVGPTGMQLRLRF
jgi:tetratricopeptide (TPR) repeat protein